MRKVNLILVIFFVIPFFFACSNTNEKTNSEEQKDSLITNNEMNEGEMLTKKYCSACHKMEGNGDQSTNGPRLAAIQKHYKPMYQGKQEFSDSMISFLKAPTIAKVLMPGAVKKFNLMPIIPVPDEDFKKITDYIFDTKFNNNKGNKNKSISVELNNGNKWKIEQELLAYVYEMKEMLTLDTEKNKAEYQQLGKDLFSVMKKCVLYNADNKETEVQIRAFFKGIENNVHNLMIAENPVEAQKLLEKLKNDLSNFENFFEV